jgi:hypothetical protein
VSGSQPTGAANTEDSGPIFRLIEYARAEQALIGTTIEALAIAGDPVLSQVGVERSSRMPNTQITTESGEVVEQQPVQIRTKLTQAPQDIIDGKLEDLFVSLDQAAEEWAGQLSKHFYSSISRIAEATGNVVDAKGRPFFDSVYEAFEKLEVHFDDEGHIQQSLILNPADVETWKKGLEEMTPEQRDKFDALIERKRQEFDARRRDRRLPRRSD